MKLKIDSGSLKSLLIFGGVVEARDAYTGGHLWRVAQFSRLLARQAGLSELEIFITTVGGYLHDLGKVGTPDNILTKPGKLDDHEFEIIKTHPSVGKKILEAHPLAPLALDSIYQHHERYDGKGYPNGLTWEETSLVARIVNIADAFDAMTSTRSYRKGMPKEKALTIFQEFKNRQFDGKLVDHFLSIAKSGRLDHIIGHSGEGIPMAQCPNCGPVIVLPRQSREGDKVLCRACTGEFNLHKNGEQFDLEFAETTGTPTQLQPSADLDSIDELLVGVPNEISMPDLVPRS